MTVKLSTKSTAPECPRTKRYRFLLRRKILLVIPMICLPGFFALSDKELETARQNDTSNFSVAVEQDTPDEYLSTSGSLSRNFLNARIPESNCIIERCQTVVCTSVQSDPGKAASDFINSIAKIKCTELSTVALKFIECKFPSNELRRNWFDTNFSIEMLKFEKCSLETIAEDAFLHNSFSETKLVVLINNNISFLKRATFQHLPKLQQLTIRNDHIKEAELNLLEDVAGTLSILELEATIGNSKILENVTGSNSLWKLRILSIRDNWIPVISGKILLGLPQLQSLYVDRSGVRKVESDAFRAMTKSLTRLTMMDNDMDTLPSGVFSFLTPGKKVLVSIENNPWRCDCKLQWLQDFVKTYPGMFTDVPKCNAPMENADLWFTEANFCNDTEASSTTVRNDETNVTNGEGQLTTIESSIKLTCDNRSMVLEKLNLWKLMNSDVRVRSSRFSAKEIQDGMIIVNLPESGDFTVMWFKSNILNAVSDRFSEYIHCVQNARHSVLLKNVESQTTYSICLLTQQNSFSPLNCLVLTTSPTYENRTWLTNGMKFTVFSLLTLIIVSTLVLSILFTFFVVRGHPELLRGNKRIMMVKRRNLDAIVLPPGHQIENSAESKLSESSKEDGYITPLPVWSPIRRSSRASKWSLQNDGASYISCIEPTLSQLTFWRLRRLKSEIRCPESDPPPLPPHPIYEVIPSLSMSVDSSSESICEEPICIL